MNVICNTIQYIVYKMGIGGIKNEEVKLTLTPQDSSGFDNHL